MSTPADGTTELTERIAAATLEAISRWGIAKTTMADVARLAGCGRASVYRCYPGGKDQLLAEVGRRELGRFFADVSAEVSRQETLDDALTTAMAASVAWVADHRALQYVLAYEPEQLLPLLGFGQVDRLYRAAGILAGPALAPFVGAQKAPWAAEWLARVVLSLLFSPPAELASDPRAAGEPAQRYLRRLSRELLVPALGASHPDPTSPEADPASLPTLTTTGS